MRRRNCGDRGCIDHAHTRRGAGVKAYRRTSEEIASAEAY